MMPRKGASLLNFLVFKQALFKQGFKISQEKALLKRGTTRGCNDLVFLYPPCKTAAMNHLNFNSRIFIYCQFSIIEISRIFFGVHPVLPNFEGEIALW